MKVSVVFLCILLCPCLPSSTIFSPLPTFVNVEENDVFDDFPLPSNLSISLEETTTTTNSENLMTSTSFLFETSNEEIEEFSFTLSPENPTEFSELQTLTPDSPIFLKYNLTKESTLKKVDSSFHSLDYMNDAAFMTSEEDSKYLTNQRDVHNFLILEKTNEGRPLPSVRIVIHPQKYVSNTIVYLKYERFSVDRKENKFSLTMSNMSDPILKILPLTSTDTEVVLEDLSDGVYLICAEAYRKAILLEKESCLLSEINYYTSRALTPGLSGGRLIALICVLSLLSIAILVVLIFLSLQRTRRRAKDKEMKERVNKMAEKEREIFEREKSGFHQIYIDPDEPYEERCIM